MTKIRCLKDKHKQTSLPTYSSCRELQLLEPEYCSEILWSPRLMSKFQLRSRVYSHCNYTTKSKKNHDYLHFMELLHKQNTKKRKEKKI